MADGAADHVGGGSAADTAARPAAGQHQRGEPDSGDGPAGGERSDLAADDASKSASTVLVEANPASGIRSLGVSLVAVAEMVEPIPG